MVRVTVTVGVRVKVRVRVRVRVSLRTNRGHMYVPPLFPGYEQPVARQVLGGQRIDKWP